MMSRNREKVVTFRATSAEHTTLRAAAEEAGRSVSEIVREAALRRARGLLLLSGAAEARDRRENEYTEARDAEVSK